jgi:N-dimethylarginine dimethylaminohydrolase
MILESKEMLEQVLAEGALLKNQVRPSRVLMVSPEHFRVEYAINPFMKNADGELNRVDEGKARIEWAKLRATFEGLGLKVDILSGVEGQPDMVFAANQSFPFRKTGGPKSVVLSKMRSEFRRGEVPHFKDWYEKRGYQVHELSGSGVFFEGNGDALIQYPYNLVWGGFGHRTSRNAYSYLSEKLGFFIVPLELDLDRHYHLDLCLSILNETTAVVFPEAFHPESLEMIRLGFPNLIEVSTKENLAYSACNCHSPDGKHVITHQGATEFVAKLRAHGFIPIELPTTEFMKAGGSVFCLKMMTF